MQPYQQAAQELRRQGELPSTIAKKGLSFGLGAATGYLGSNTINKVLPFLSKYVPENLAIKALSKINPGYEKFINKALQNGQSFEEVQNFIREKVEDYENKEQKKSAQNEKNILEQYSPELFNFIQGEVSKGRPVLEAGAMANILDKFKPIIKKITEDHKTPFSSILQTIFGQDQGVNPEQENTQEQQRQQGLQQFNKKLQNAANVQKGMDNISNRRQFSPAVEQALAKIMSM
jgi:hypothetical protein